jgi:hypothetical protein
MIGIVERLRFDATQYEIQFSKGVASNTPPRKRYLREAWYAPTPPGIKKGDYVLASKYRDGDPEDQFCIGFYDGSFGDGTGTRHLVVDSQGKQFRRNGFRRVARSGTERGKWMVKHIKLIEEYRDRFSVWHWWRASWKELSIL